MKIYLIIAICLLFSGCAAKKDAIGKYMSKSNPNFLEIRKDKTFIYEYRALHLYQQSIGKWENTDNGGIRLSSEIKSTRIPIMVNNQAQITDGNNISIKLNIEGNEKLADYKCKVYINNQVTA
jgi:hypothetical protein